VTAFSLFRQQRKRIARLVLAAFLLTSSALVWQPCVHAFEQLQASEQQQEITAAQEPCLHCPPQADDTHDCGDDAVAYHAVADSTDVERSSPPADARLAKSLFVDLPLAYLEAPRFERVHGNTVPSGRSAPLYVPPRHIVLTFGVLLI
jgi:hypothetical protein